MVEKTQGESSGFAKVCGFSTEDFCPLVVNFNNKDGTPKWTLFFQSKPKLRVWRKGAMPTIEEMLQAVQFLPVPAFMVQVFVICAASAEVED